MLNECLFLLLLLFLFILILFCCPNCMSIRDRKVRLEIAFFASVGKLFLFEVPRGVGA